MFYKPRYCCNCGEKIEREDWRLWTSRRFCALCETEYKPYDLLPRAVVIVGIVFVLFGIGTFFRTAEPTGQRLAMSAKPSPNLKPITLLSAPIGNTNVQVSDQTIKMGAEQLRSEINEQPNKEKRTSDETVFFCGALTKKGTPCTRRVKRQGFCWQHAKVPPVAPARF